MIPRHDIREAQKDMMQSGLAVAVNEKAALTLPPVSADTIQTISRPFHRQTYHRRTPFTTS